MSGIRAWFDARSLREKRLLIVMIALAAALAIWGGIVLPVQDGLSSSRERHRDAVTRVGAIEATLADVRRAERDRAQPPAGGFDAAVRASAEQAGFTLATLNAMGPDRVQAGIGSARPGALMAWIASMEASGILVDSVAITDNGDQTVAARMTLTRRAP